MQLDKRIKFIDIAKAWAIIFIVIGHTIVYSEHCRLVFKVLYSFHVALFFILSGYTAKQRDNKLDYIKGRFKSLIIPYFIWSVIFLIPYIVFGNSLGLKSAAESSFDVKTQILNIIYGNGNNCALKQNSSLWFLPALFSMQLIYVFVIDLYDKIPIKNKKIISTIVLFIIGQLSVILLKDVFFPWGINTVLEYGVFYFLGYILQEFKINKFKKK